MTEHQQIESLDATIKGFLASDNEEVVDCAEVAKEILFLLEKSRAECYWLAEREESCPSDAYATECRLMLNSGKVGDCAKCWLKAAKEIHNGIQ